MTARQVWEGMLTELSKVKAPSLLLQDFNYFFNKAINQYINKRYNIYDVNLQTTDDLRVLKSTAILNATPINCNTAISDLTALGAGAAKLFGATYEVNLPLDYLHMLNCVCIYKLNKRYKCYNAGDVVLFAAKRLTADAWSIIINDYYNRPLPERPYYYIHNLNSSTTLPTNPVNLVISLNTTFTGTDSAKDYTHSNSVTLYVYKYKTSIDGPELTTDNSVLFNHANEVNTQLKDNPNLIITETVTKKSRNLSQSNLPRSIDLKGFNNTSVVEKEAGVRYGNASNVRCEIRYGYDNSVFQLEKVFIDYIKAPQVIRLTQELVNLTEDTSLIMEFPDYVCQEIINELTMLVMENTADPRLQTNLSVTQSIANPAQQLTPQPQS